MAYTIKLRRDVAADWTELNPTLAEGEPGLELDTGKIKFGDGSTAWTSLAYHLPEPDVQALIDDAIENAELVGVPGASAYDVAVENGFVGTEEEWLESLIGPQGTAGTNGTNGTNGSNGADGAPGEDGDDGAPGADGEDGESVTVTLVDFGDWPPAEDLNPLHLYFRLPEA